MKKSIILLFFILPFFLSAQVEWDKMDADVEALCNNGEFDKALKLALQHKTIIEKKVGTSSDYYPSALKNIAVCCFYLREYSLAEQYISLAKTYGEKCCSLSVEYAEIIHTQGYIFKEINQPEKALQSFLQSLEILKQAHYTDELLLGSYYSDIAFLYVQLGKMNEASEAYTASYILLQKFPNAYQYPYVLNNLGDFYHSLHDFTKAFDFYSKALDVTEKQVGKEHYDYANIVGNIGNLYADFGMFHKASPYFYNALHIVEKVVGVSSLEYAQRLNDIGWMFQYEGDFTQSEKYYRRALSIKDSVVGKQHPTYWKTLNNIGLLQHTLGNYVAAQETFTQLIQLIPESMQGNFPEYGNYINSLGSVLLDREELSAAEIQFKKALEFYGRYYGKDPNYSRVLNNLGLLYFKRKSFARAKEYYTKSLTILEQNSKANPLDVAISYNNLGELYSFQQSFDTAQFLFTKALQFIQTELSPYHPYVWTIQSNQLLLLHRKGETYKACIQAKEFVTYTLEMYYKQLSFLSHTEQLSYYRKLSDFFDFYFSIASTQVTLHPELVGDIWNVSIATKSLVTDFNKRLKLAIEREGNPEVKRKFADWQTTVQLLATYYNYSTAQLKQQGVPLDSIENRVTLLEKELMTLSKQFDLVKKTPTTNWKDIQAKLTPQDAAVQIIRVNKFNRTWTDSILYVAFVLKKETVRYPEVVVLDNGNALEHKYYKGYLNAIRSQLSLENSYKVYWKPIDDKIISKSNIYLSVEGVFNKINIQTLSSSSDYFVIQSKSIQVVPIFRNFIWNTSKSFSSDSKSIVLLGKPDYSNLPTPKRDSLNVNYTTASVVREVKLGYQLNELPGTLIEVNTIENVLQSKGWNVTKHTGIQASESTIKAVVNPRILHIATHGYFSKVVADEDTSLAITKEYEVNPMLRSGLLLAGADYTLSHVVQTDTDDGIFTAFEAMTLQLSKTELVILSACETGLGDDSYGEGVFGLQKAFILAGTKYMLMSLWKVDDAATQELMVLFYQQYVAGNSVTLSFRNAQLELMKKDSDPRLWGAFVLIAQ